MLASRDETSERASFGWAVISSWKLCVAVPMFLGVPPNAVESLEDILVLLKVKTDLGICYGF